jgi:hypothetical protein
LREEIKMKVIDKIKVGLAASVYTAALIFGVYMVYDAVRNPVKSSKPQTGLIWSDESKREYAGKVRIFSRGAERKIYVDRKPFGSLDGVRTELYTDSGLVNTIQEREPESAEVDTFNLLESYGKKEHPAF